MKDSNLKITSMKDINELFLEQGYNVTINHDNSDARIKTVPVKWKN